MKLIMDASMALGWIFERTNKKEASCANQALEELAKSEASVPTLWHTEIANALIVAERRHVVTEAQIIDYLNKLSELPILTDNASVENHRNSVVSLAREYNLTAYDATYMELALRSNAELATFDGKLATAMRKAGGIVFGDK
jgi:predicted nucleic acid-binding protein